MDDLTLGRRAVARGFLTDDQLNECREIAVGGRSLLAIILEMGYLRTEDLGALFEAAPPPRSNRWGWCVVALSVAAAAGALLTLFVSSERRLEQTKPPHPPRVVYPPEFSHADALQEAYGREKEQKWEEAREQFRLALRKSHESAPAAAGLSRCYLALRNPSEAVYYANLAVANDTRSGEAHLALGRALLQLNEVGPAKTELLKARECDPGLRRTVDRLLESIQEE